MNLNETKANLIVEHSKKLEESLKKIKTFKEFSNNQKYKDYATLTNRFIKEEYKTITEILETIKKIIN